MADRERIEDEAVPGRALHWRQPVEAVTQAGLAFDRDADETERAALRDVCDLVEVPRMEAHFVLKPWRKTGYSVKGHVSADVVQSCVVTLEPVRQTIDEEVDVKFVPAREAEKWAEEPDAEGEIVIDPEAEDPPDLFEGNAIDVGALAAEYFALGLDPYPRAPGVAFDSGADTDEDNTDTRKPFAGLKEMMEERGGKGSKE